jgi:integrase
MPKIALSNALIKTLHCPAGQRKIEYCDTQFPGFLLELRATNPHVGTLYLRYKNDRGKTQYEKLGTTAELTIPQARKKAKQVKAAIMLGADPRVDKRKRRGIPTFNDFVQERYLPYVKVRKRSWETDASFLKNYLVPVFGDQPLDTITRQKVTTFHMSLREKGLAPASCDRQLRLLSYLFNLAIHWEVITTNPVKGVAHFNADNKKERYLTQDELNRLLGVLKTDANRVVSLIILLLLATGARRNEALKACWEDVDLPNLQWRIPAENSKSKKARLIPLNDTAVAIFQEAKRQCPSDNRVFISSLTGKPINNITSVWYRLRQQAGLPEFRLHDCRHQYASMLVNSGRTLYEVQTILGHSNPQVTLRYAHLSQKTLQQAANAAATPLGAFDFAPLDSPDTPPTPQDSSPT